MTLREMALCGLVAMICLAAGECAAGSEDKPSRPSRSPAKTPDAPYGQDSPWNLRIGPDPDYDRYSRRLLENLRGPFGCDPTQYTYPVYDEISPDTPVREIMISGVYSDVTEGGAALELRKDLTVRVPLPDGAEPSRGSDGQLIVTDPATGDEWGFWRFRRRGDGSLVARNGYHYNVNWSGVPPLGFVSRGAGVPYLAGLIRPGEIKAGRIGHALAFGCQDPGGLFVYPATKSDGEKDFPALPEGSRLQLDPQLDDSDFEEWGLSPAGKTIARALQEYGMILVDGSGHPKIYVEDHHTADWEGLLRAETVAPIPYSAFRVLSLAAPSKPPKPPEVTAWRERNGVALRWKPSPSATRYRIRRRRKGKGWVSVDRWVVKTQYTDTAARPAAGYEYSLQAVSHNGVSEAVHVQVDAGR